MFDGRKSRVFLKVLDLLENSAVEISDTLEVSAAHSAGSSTRREEGFGQIPHYGVSH